MSAVVTLKKGEGRMVKSGGMWIFDNEIESVMGTFENGDLVLVHDFDGYPMGIGFINRNSKIRVRLFSRKEDTVIDEAFFRTRLQQAWEYRKKTVDTSSCRVVFGEADFLPGLVIDKFSDVLVVQSLALGIDRYKELIVKLLKEILAEDGITIRGVYERSDAKVRKQEGMELKKGFIGEAFDTNVEIVENGVHYIVDVKDGQKTGFFLDQKYNRLAIQKLCEEAIEYETASVCIRLLYPYRLLCIKCRNCRSKRSHRSGCFGTCRTSGRRKCSIERSFRHGKIPVQGCL